MIDALFAYAGLDDRYADAFGNPAEVSRESKIAILRALGYEVHDDASAARTLREARARERQRKIRPVYAVCAGESGRWPRELRRVLERQAKPGYYDVEIEGERARAIVAPPRAYVAASVDAAPRWGIGAQLYALRSSQNWGIGDFGDLARLCAVAERSGASFVGLNPLHQLHLIHPQDASPYAPLSRRFLNALYVDVGDAARRFGVDVSTAEAARLRDDRFVDYPAVAALKLRALERIYEAADVASEIEAFACAHPGVRDVALYEAIAEEMFRRDPTMGSWLQWPQVFRDARSAGVRAFADEHARRIEFFVFLQWLADEQLARAAHEAASMPIGLYRDLAIGAELGSADVWADPDAYVLGLAVGAPPDPLNTHGQDWGLPPLHPRVLAERAYEPFIALLRANMRHAGALRIDHVMGLKRLFCIPRALPEAGGAYLNYDFEAMLAIVALESHRHGCMIVGEDLGTVPGGFRERIATERIFSCRVLYFETEGGSYRSPGEYPRDAVASTGTHDLPPFAAYWISLDDPSREALVRALKQAGALPASMESPELDDALQAVHRFLGSSKARLVLAQLEDMLAQREQVNVPGTTTEEPNWKRTYSTPIEALESHETFAAIARTLRETRPLEERGLA